MQRNHLAIAPPGYLSRRHRAIVVGAAVLLLASGVAWLALHYGTAGDEFGGRSPFEAWCLRVHGLATMVFLVVLGSLLPGHVTRGWGGHRNRRTGAGMVAAAVLLAFSGYMLYYAGDETLRPWIGVLHWGLGLAATPLLGWHALGVRRRQRRAKGGDEERLRDNRHRAGARRLPQHAATALQPVEIRRYALVGGETAGDRADAGNADVDAGDAGANRADPRRAGRAGA